jgi:hypothetical protein
MLWEAVIPHVAAPMRAADRAWVAPSNRLI